MKIEIPECEQGIKCKIYLNIGDVANECLTQKVPKSESLSIWKGKIFLSSFFNLSLLDPLTGSEFYARHKNSWLNGAAAET